MIAVDWGSVEETFLVWRIEGRTSFHDYQRAYEMSHRLISKKDYFVDMIVDLRMGDSDLQILPRALAYHQNHCPDKLNRIIMIVPDVFLQRHFRMVEDFFGILLSNCIFAFSVDEAYSFVLQTD